MSGLGVYARVGPYGGVEGSEVEDPGLGAPSTPASN
jgi:hypothetical protein